MVERVGLGFFVGVFVGNIAAAHPLLGLILVTLVTLALLVRLYASNTSRT